MIMNGVVIGKEGFTEENTRVIGTKHIEFNARNQYAVEDVHTGKLLTVVNFQNGPVKEFGVNGAFNEDLLLMVVDRLESFQNSEFKCDENDEAIHHIMKAIESLRARTNKRKERGVEGTHEV